MLPALVELKRYILEQSMDGWNSVEHARTVTRTLEAILKVAEVKIKSASEEDQVGEDDSCSLDSASDSDNGVWSEEEDEADSEVEEKDRESDEEDCITFRTTLLDESGSSLGYGYEADTEEKLSNNTFLTDEGGGTADRARSEGQRHLHEGVTQIVMEILFELSKKCVTDPLLWSTNLNAVLTHLSVVSRSLGGSEAILRGFSVVLESNDVRLRQLQRSILALVRNIETPGSLLAFTSLLTVQRPPVELLLPKFYELTVADMEIREPICQLEFPTRNGEWCL